MTLYKILYGYGNTYIDITSAVFSKCSGLNEKNYFVLTIPQEDLKRGALFSDPLHGVQKNIQIYRDNMLWRTIEHDQTFEIPIFASIPRSYDIVNTMLHNIHNSLNFQYGYLQHELPEQLMLCKFLPKDAKVLEIGSNIGRTSLVIASILNDDTQFVTIESSKESASLLRVNKDVNKKTFHIVNAALSLQPLYQVNMSCSTVKTDDSTPVDIISIDELYRKYPISFDTLVVDCEGSFYYILKDFPSILDGINLFIIENDYTDNHIEKKQYVDNILYQKKFHCVYRETLGNLEHPSNDFFYEVWQRFL